MARSPSAELESALTESKPRVNLRYACVDDAGGGDAEGSRSEVVADSDDDADGPANALRPITPTELHTAAAPVAPTPGQPRPPSLTAPSATPSPQRPTAVSAVGPLAASSGRASLPVQIGSTRGSSTIGDQDGVTWERPGAAGEVHEVAPVTHGAHI